MQTETLEQHLERTHGGQPRFIRLHEVRDEIPHGHDWSGTVGEFQIGTAVYYAWTEFGRHFVFEKEQVSSPEEAVRRRLKHYPPAADFTDPED